jgi:hypothetical protein
MYVVSGVVAGLIVLVIGVLVWSLFQKKNGNGYQPVKFDYTSDTMIADSY